MSADANSRGRLAQALVDLAVSLHGVDAGSGALTTPGPREPSVGWLWWAVSWGWSIFWYTALICGPIAWFFFGEQLREYAALVADSLEPLRPLLHPAAEQLKRLTAGESRARVASAIARAAGIYAESDARLRRAEMREIALRQSLLAALDAADEARAASGQALSLSADNAVLKSSVSTANARESELLAYCSALEDQLAMYENHIADAGAKGHDPPRDSHRTDRHLLAAARAEAHAEALEVEVQTLRSLGTDLQNTCARQRRRILTLEGELAALQRRSL